MMTAHATHSRPSVSWSFHFESADIVIHAISVRPIAKAQSSDFRLTLLSHSISRSNMKACLGTSLDEDRIT
jgi:hypothetical protein